MPGTGVPEASHVDETARSGPETGAPEAGESRRDRRASRRLRLRVRLPALLTVVAMLAVLGLATGLRAATLRAGAPYTTYIDEHFPLKGSARQISDQSWDPDFYLYPSLVVNATSVSATALAILRGDNGQLRAGSRVTVASPYIEVVEPWTLILAGRLIVLLLSVATVLLVGLLGMRLAGRAVGILAALFVAVLPIFVTRGSIVIVDTPAACFTTAALYCVARVTSARHQREVTTWVVLGGAACGLAFTSKYTVGFLLVSIFVVVALRRERSIAQRLALGAAAVGGFVLSAVVSMPELVLRPSAVVDAVRVIQHAYSIGSTDSYLQQLAQPSEFGLPVLLVGLIGLGVLLYSRRTRTVAIAYLVFAIPTVAVLLKSPFQPVRNVLPLIPFLVIAAATAILTGARFVGSRLHLPRAVQIAGALLLVLVLCWSPFRAGTKQYITTQRALTDTRVTVRRWMETHVHAGDRVLVAEEIAFLPAELSRICADVVVQSQQRATAVDDYDWVIMGDLDPKRWPSPWTQQIAGRTKALTVGRYPTSGVNLRVVNAPLVNIWHGSAERIHVIGPPAGRPQNPGRAPCRSTGH